jgi:HTH-type transcriptional regulator / antitoxin HigA
MPHIKLIKTPEDYARALARLSELMKLAPAADTPEGDELEVLALLIEKYEKETFPMDRSDPVEAIRFRMDQQGLSNKDLIPFLGSGSKVSEVLSGKRSLSLAMIRRLSQGLGIPVEVLIQEPRARSVAG